VTVTFIDTCQRSLVAPGLEQSLINCAPVMPTFMETDWFMASAGFIDNADNSRPTATASFFDISSPP
jgi:hypothetical protein